MIQVKIKTREELIKEFGYSWRYLPNTVSFVRPMDENLGKILIIPKGDFNSYNNIFNTMCQKSSTS